MTGHTPLTKADVDDAFARVEAWYATAPAAERERYANEARAAELSYSRPTCHVPITPRADEGAFAHSNRAWRWEMWYRQEPRPCFWFATPDEIAVYREWRIAVLRARGYDEHGQELQ